MKAHEEQMGKPQHPGLPDLAQPGASQDGLECLEYVVVHEEIHLLEGHHSDRFREVPGRALPRWRHT